MRMILRKKKTSTNLTEKVTRKMTRPMMMKKIHTATIPQTLLQTKKKIKPTYNLKNRKMAPISGALFYWKKGFQCSFCVISPLKYKPGGRYVTARITHRFKDSPPS